MGCISTVDLQTKMEVQELVSRFCHFLDHNNAQEWTRLFTTDCHLDAGSVGIFNGRAAIIGIPELVYAKSAGNWRHHLSNVMIDRTGNARELEIHAYCLVTDWSKKGALISCYDFHARLQNRCHWQIADLKMRPVGACDGNVAERAAAEKSLSPMMLN
ncbi:MAG: nuclear transport factor 2 family protein [Sphingobium phenoxybenzoativorans]|uniref:Nuclear transport factor 2 family protein n=1 Tax=Sphingobium phenoxybenzoativorans TaxID=1592790 RepID=A0A975K7S6_9SPHN|nr:nuclear transport factor 2 family protein [Sphingobium phenoxybenzoativorans]QUT06375.1 nuclear transport factor 2 family protein [Sphingobium phenoxybenzoativorans]